jgi:hypothetical protein
MCHPPSDAPDARSCCERATPLKNDDLSTTETTFTSTTTTSSDPASTQSATAFCTPSSASYFPANITSPDRPEWRPIPVSTFAWRPLNENQTAQLAALGLHTSEYDFFRDHFVGHPFNYGHKPLDKEWFSPNPRSRITHALLIGHLAGRYHLGTYCGRGALLNTDVRYVTDRFVIDLDAGGDERELLARHDAVMNALGVPTLVSRSSSSGGLHLHYWLDEYVDLHRLRTPDGNGLVPRLLAASGLREASGQIEIYPQAHYRTLRSGNRLRLPFGSESRLLDARTLEPLTSGSGTSAQVTDLRFVRAGVESGEIEPVSFSELFERAKATPWLTTTRARGSRDSKPTRDGAETAAFLQHGLTAHGQLDRALGLLSFKHEREGLNRQAAITAIERWLDANHNGQSRTYNHQRESVPSKIRARVERIYSDGAKKRKSPGRAWVSREWAPVGGLSRWEASHLLDATWSGCDRDTGVEVDRYKLQCLCFAMMTGAKSWVLTACQKAWDAVEQEFKPGSEAFARALLTRCSEFWPDPAAPSFIVAIPYEHRLRRGGLSRGSLMTYWRAACSTGLFKLTQKAEAHRHRCEYYRVELDFAAFDSRTIHGSVDALLIAELSRENRKQGYSEYRIKLLNRFERSSPVVPSTGACVSPFESFLRVQLGSGIAEPSRGSQAA